MFIQPSLGAPAVSFQAPATISTPPVATYMPAENNFVASEMYSSQQMPSVMPPQLPAGIPPPPPGFMPSVMHGMQPPINGYPAPPPLPAEAPPPMPPNYAPMVNPQMVQQFDQLK